MSSTEQPWATTYLGIELHHGESFVVRGAEETPRGVASVAVSTGAAEYAEETAEHPVPVGYTIDALVQPGLRRNPRRAHLLVSTVLGKHLPTDPRVVIGAGEQLGDLVRAKLGDRDAVVLGFAETATGLGHCVAARLDAACYLHSTRRHESRATTLAGFEEGHSHATSHLLQPAPAEIFANDLPLVLVDDEISTGDTAIDAVRALHGFAPRSHYVLASLVDMRTAADRAKFEAFAAELGARIDTVCLATGRVDLPAGLIDKVTALPDPALNPVAARRGSFTRLELQWPADVPEGGRHGILSTDAAAFDIALKAATAEVQARLDAGFAGRPVIVLGHEELMYLPLRLATELADSGTPARFQTTTRSPAYVLDEPGYPLRRGFRFTAPEPDPTADRYLYNAQWTDSDVAPVLLVVLDPPADTPELVADGGLVDVLTASGADVVVAVVPGADPRALHTSRAGRPTSLPGTDSAAIPATDDASVVAPVPKSTAAPVPDSPASDAETCDAKPTAGEPSRAADLAAEDSAALSATARGTNAGPAAENSAAPQATVPGVDADETIGVKARSYADAGRRDSAEDGDRRPATCASRLGGATARSLPEPLHGPEFGSYAAEDVSWLLKDLSHADLEADVAERERRIQAGIAHYAESLPVEYQPDAEYRELFDRVLAESAERLALAVATVAELVVAERGENVVLVSLARAGTPVGVLMRRWLASGVGRPALDVPHYAVSIVRDRGIDAVALDYLAHHHDPASIVFVDGWTGKGAITHELTAALDAYHAAGGARFNDELVVLADPANCVRTYGTRDDFLIASACLNSTVSGLVSRTVLNDTLIGPGDFHGAKFYRELAGSDVSNQLVDAVTAAFETVRDRVPAAVAEIQAADRTPNWSGWASVERVKAEYGISTVNFVKPGVGETTRVLLRRVPWRVLVRAADAPEHAHIRLLAAARNVPVEVVPDLAYSCMGLIKELDQ
ncbi:phosphoribosyltransferase domain-containing protein [Nocardia neocaledoniensis]|uniref:phosphoribosyltransferase domain-containing protein n=1 Tax=Nocardia neocaledoniensis TaxID=236511 RepID=UPI002454D56C|nr:phosphoribosyltransferase domain-containing protein [Nocardia neocaledoniensis]